MEIKYLDIKTSLFHVNYFILFWFCFLILLSGYSCKNKVSDHSHLLIGMAEVNYTPEIGLDLVGNYRGNDYASRGVHDSLYARAIVFNDQENEKVAVLSVDICWLTRESVEKMRSYASSKTGIATSRILIHATHTHSGPKGEWTAPKASEYLTKAASAIEKANENMMPARISASMGKTEGIAFNRRLELKDGTTHMSWEPLDKKVVIGPLGETDPSLLTVWIEQNGKSTGCLVNFACHPATLTGNNWLYSADYPGYLAQNLKQARGKDFIPIFINGFCGNVTQVNYKRGFIDTFEECKRIGNLLSLAVLNSTDNMEDIRRNGISAMTEMVPVKKMTISDEQYQWALEVMERVREKGMPPLQKDGIPNEQYAAKWIEMYSNQNEVDSLEVMAIRIGKLAILGFPGEMFSEFGLAIRKQSPFRFTLLSELSNDARKYFPTKISFNQGPKGFTPMITGYETTPGTSMYDIGSGEKLTCAGLRLLFKINH